MFYTKQIQNFLLRTTQRLAKYNAPRFYTYILTTSFYSLTSECFKYVIATRSCRLIVYAKYNKNMYLILFFIAFIDRITTAARSIVEVIYYVTWLE